MFGSALAVMTAATCERTPESRRADKRRPCRLLNVGSIHFAVPRVSTIGTVPREWYNPVTMPNIPATFASIDALQEALRTCSYIAERGLATSIYLALKLQRPLFLEGEAGVGKTEIAKVLTDLLGVQLIRLQCYEGLDINHAVYEWNYTRQMMHIRLLEAAHSAKTATDAEAELFGPQFLLKRPLLQALETEPAPVLLIDELDRSDAEFEAYLLEVLSDFQVTIPEIGTIRAKQAPVVVITSNRTREIHDALKRRCLYHWIDYPTFEKELEIVRSKAPQAPITLSRQVTAFIQELRREELYKYPGVAESLDWITALVALDQKQLDAAIVDETLGVILKYRDDVDKIKGGNAKLILERAGVKAAA
jgi:MoxR-like ATPase